MAPTKEGKKFFIPLESNPALFTELIHALGMSRRLAFHDVLTLSPSSSPDDAELLALVPRPALALVVVVPAPDGYARRLQEEETEKEKEKEKDVGIEDDGDRDGDVVFFHQTIGNACGLYATLHAVCNGEARGFMEPSTHVSVLMKKCEPLDRAGRIEVLESDEALAAAHASVASRGDTAPPEDITAEPFFAYMAFVKARSGRLYQLEGCRKGPVDVGCVLGADEDLLSDKALDAVRKFAEQAGRGVAVGYSAMALSVTNGESE